MWRIALRCTESHPLYGIFMANLSSCIFESDLAQQRVNSLQLVCNVLLRESSKESSDMRIAYSPLQSRVHETTQLIKDLILSSMATDTLGVPLLKEDERLYEVSRSTLSVSKTCLLPNCTHWLDTRWKVESLPVWRCAHGSTSVDFTSPDLFPAQVPILLTSRPTCWKGSPTGMSWEVVIDSPSHPLRTFISHLQHKVCYHHYVHIKCDCIWQNPAYGICTLFAQCVHFPQVDGSRTVVTSGGVCTHSEANFNRSMGWRGTFKQEQQRMDFD